MLTKVIMPKFAANIEEATIGQWFIGEGEPVAEGDLLFEAITDKAAVEVAAEGSGVLRKVYARENSVVPVGQVIAAIADAGEPLPEIDTTRPAPKREAPRAVKASFGARRLAKELGIAVESLIPSRPDGRLTEDDVRRAAAMTQGPPVLERIPLSPLKRALASHLGRSLRQAVAYVTLEADFSAVEAALPGLSEEAGLAVRARDVVLHAAAALLKDHRLLNACFTDEAIVVYQPVNVGLVVDVEQDCTVAVPVLHDAGGKSVAEIAREAAALVERAGTHALDLSALANATFTFADQSGLGIDNFVPILNERQSAILAMSSARLRPVFRGERVVAAPIASLAVAFDHRVLNATAAAGFLHALRDKLEQWKA